MGIPLNLKRRIANTDTADVVKEAAVLAQSSSANSTRQRKRFIMLA